MENSRYMRSMLLDFYGALLTDKQRECFQLHYNDDLSLAEIAEQSGISRQGVWDNIRRAEMTLNDIEEKTALVRRFEETTKALGGLRQQLEELRTMTDGEAQRTVDKALSQLDALKYEE